MSTAAELLTTSNPPTVSQKIAEAFRREIAVNTHRIFEQAKSYDEAETLVERCIAPALVIEDIKHEDVFTAHLQLRRTYEALVGRKVGVQADINYIDNMLHDAMMENIRGERPGWLSLHREERRVELWRARLRRVLFLAMAAVLGGGAAVWFLFDLYIQLAVAGLEVVVGMLMGLVRLVGAA